MVKFVTVVLLLITIVFTGCGGKESAANTNKGSTSDEARKIVIGIDDEFAPISFHDEHNALVGFDIDLAKEAAERMGVEIEFKSIDWDKKKEEITSGNIDMIWNGLDITEERKEYMIFTRSYMNDRQIILIRKGEKHDIYVEGDLEGKVVGVQAGSTSDDYINEDENLKNSLKEFKTYIRFNDLVQALKDKEIDVLICDELIARYEANRHPGQFEVLNVRIGSVAEMAVGFRKDNSELRDRVQAVFDEMIADGTAKKISEQWFQADVIKQR